MADDKKDSLMDFSGFVRDIGVRAFDKLADKLADHENEVGVSALKETATNAAQRLAGYWSTMNSKDKDTFFDQVIAAATLVVASAPAVVMGMKKSPEKKKGTEKKADEKKASSKSARSLVDAEATLPVVEKKKKKSHKDKGKKKKSSDKDGKKDHKKQ